MPRARDPNRDKAFEIYKAGKGNIDLVEIASQLSLLPGTVRGWKSKDQWDNKMKGTFQMNTERNGTDNNISWIMIEKEYVTDIRKKPCSLEEISDKYNIPIQTVYDQSAKNKWSDKRKEYKESTKQKILEKASDKDAERILKLLAVTDTATLKAEQSLTELETYLVKNKHKVKTVEYKDVSSPGKPTKEVIDENESIETVPGPIDRQGLLFVTTSLKNIKDLYSITNDNELHRHKIDNDNAKLELERKKADPEDGKEGVKYTGIPATMIAPAFARVVFDIADHEHNEYVFPGGRGSAKSTFVSLQIMDLLEKNPEIHAAIFRQVGQTLRDSVYAQMCWAIMSLGLEDEYKCNISPMEITKKSTGQKIFFRGNDDPMKSKGIKAPFGYIGILWFEELDQFKGEEAVRTVTQSVLRGGDITYTFKTFNPPKSANNWANKYIKVPKPKMLVTFSTYLGLPKAWLGKDFLDEAEHLKEVNPIAYENEYMGVANGTGGNVFDNLTIRTITDEEIAGFDRIYYGVDWGWFPDPWAFNKVYYNAAQHKLYILDEDRRNKTGNEETARILKDEHGLTPNDKITCDNAENKSVADYKSYGLFARAAIKGPGSVEYSMKWLASLTEIVIDNSRTPHTAMEFVDYEYERDKDGNIISGYPDKNNHNIDAIRYALEEVWKRRGQ